MESVKKENTSTIMGVFNAKAQFEVGSSWQ